MKTNSMLARVRSAFACATARLSDAVNASAAMPAVAPAVPVLFALATSAVATTTVATAPLAAAIVGR